METPRAVAAVLAPPAPSPPVAVAAGAQRVRRTVERFVVDSFPPTMGTQDSGPATADTGGERPR